VVIDGSAIYVGHVVHQRVGGIAHGFRYPMSMLLLDVDEVERLDARLRLFGYNRARVVSLRDRDHLGDPAQPIAANIRALLRREGVASPIARVFLLTQCRVLGYVFNPVSFFYAFGADGALAAVVPEVHNTFGARHPYVLVPDRASAEWRPEEKKVFHVSPFFTVDGHYRFAIDVPADRVTIRIDLHDKGALRLASRLTLARRPLSDAMLARVLLRHPLMPHRVIAGIHWHALRLWLKGARYSRTGEVAAPVGSREAAPLGSREAAPLGSTEAAPLGSTEAAPLGSTEAAPPGSTEAAPPGSTEAAPPGSTEAVPLGSTRASREGSL
jgi:DUF1365 family protein